jgi:hypothetical protein
MRLPKLRVAGSIPVVRSKKSPGNEALLLDPRTTAMAQEAQVQAFLQASTSVRLVSILEGLDRGEMGPFRLVRPPQHHLCVLPLIKGCVHVSETRRSSGHLPA